MLIERLGGRIRPSLHGGRAQGAIIVLVHRNAVRLAIDLARAGYNDLAPMTRACRKDVLGSSAVDEQRSERICEDVRHPHGGGEMEDAIMRFDQTSDGLLIQNRVLYQANRVVVCMLGEVGTIPGGEIVEHSHRVALLDEPVDKVAADEPSPTGHQRLHAMAPYQPR